MILCARVLVIMYRGVTDTYGQPLTLTYVSSAAQLSPLCALRDGEYRVVAISHAMTPYQRRQHLARSMRGWCIAWVAPANRQRSGQFAVDITGYIPRRGLIEIAWNTLVDSPAIVVIYRDRWGRQHVRVWDMMSHMSTSAETWRATVSEIHFIYPSYDGPYDAAGQRSIIATVNGYGKYKFVIGRPAVTYAGPIRTIGVEPVRKNTVVRAYLPPLGTLTTRIRAGRP